MRLDQALVARDLAPSRARAAQLIAAGVVTVDGHAQRKASFKVSDQVLAVTEDVIPWVSRAALKLVHALDTFGLEPQGDCLDLGASTGGFTQVLLARGAARVFAVDVGRDQLHREVAEDPRVLRMDGVNAKELGAQSLPPLDWIVTDVSFISLQKALPPALSLAKPGARLVALIKPQFEVGRGAVGKGGIVKDAAARADAVVQIGIFLEQSGWDAAPPIPSPITGSDGNVEHLITAVRR